MRLESIADWMAFLSHKMWEMREHVGNIPKGSPDFRIEEDMVNFQDEVDVTIRRFCQRAQAIKIRARDAKENFEKKEGGEK